jgi:hypothetical protein
MIENLPAIISLIFGLTTIGTLLFFCWAIKKSASEKTNKKATIIFFVLVIWLVIQAVLTLSHIYNSGPTSMPPKILLIGIFPTLLTIIFLFVNRGGQQFVDSLPLTYITYLNVVRIPVEVVLLCLFVNKAVPRLMTFEGRNFDILSGITAPFIAYYGFTRGKLSSKLILGWNLVCLALLMNIVVNALLSAPFPFQRFAFDQPNIAIFNFPFSWLPTFIVPIVLLGHLTSIRRYFINKKPKNSLVR